MKKVGIIENIQDVNFPSERRYEYDSAAEFMAATGGNTGNIAFVHAANKIIGNPKIKVDWGWSPERVREQVDHLVICCANQLGAHADLRGWAEQLEKFNLPVTLLGLGAQSDSFEKIPDLPEGTIKFIDLVKNLSASSETNIAVRGDFTKSVLKQYNISSNPLGCPSLHSSNLSDLGSVIFKNQKSLGDIKRVAVAAGNPWHGPSALFERILVDIVNNFHGEYIVQHPESMVQFVLGEVDKITEKTKNRFLEIYGNEFDFDQLIEWYRHNSSIYVDVPNWSRALKRADLVLGPRYHGVALAIQVGRPGCVITIDSRTEELCLGTAIKNINVKDAIKFSSEELLERSLWSQDDALAFDENRLKRAKGYVDFLRENELIPSAHLLSNAGMNSC